MYDLILCIQLLDANFRNVLKITRRMTERNVIHKTIFHIFAVRSNEPVSI